MDPIKLTHSVQHSSGYLLQWMTLKHSNMLFTIVVKKKIKLSFKTIKWNCSIHTVSPFVYAVRDDDWNPRKWHVLSGDAVTFPFNWLYRTQTESEMEMLQVRTGKIAAVTFTWKWPGCLSRPWRLSSDSSKALPVSLHVTQDEPWFKTQCCEVLTAQADCAKEEITEVLVYPAHLWKLSSVLLSTKNK